MKHLFIVIVLMTTMIFTGCSSHTNEERVLTDAQWIEDIDYLEERLRYFHSDLFKFISEDEWNKNIENLKSEVPQLSDISIKLRITQMLASIGDAHTVLLPGDIFLPVPSTLPLDENPADIEGIVEFPIKCDFFDDGLRVVECDPKYNEVLGYKLISINNIDIGDITSDISTLIAYDYGNEHKGIQHANKFLNIYEVLKFYNIVDSDKAEYVFEDDNDERVKLSVKAKENENINYVGANKKEMKTNIMPEGAYDEYWYSSFKEDDILFFKFNRFITDSTGKEYPNFDDFLEGLLEEINSNKCEKLVIDVRENGGGSTKVLNALVENINYRTDLEGEDIYIITGKKSGSASVTLAFNMQSKKGATIVGETTGGNVNLFSAGGQIELPNSKLKPVISSTPRINKEGYNGGVKPNIEVKQNYEDYINGIDTCYEYIKNLGD